MISGLRQDGRHLSVLIGFAILSLCATLRTVEGSSTAACLRTAACTPVGLLLQPVIVRPAVPPGVLAVSRFISRRYRVGRRRARQIAATVFRVSKKNRLNPYLVLAVIAVESSFRPNVVNRYGGAYGLMQIAVRVHERRVAAVGGRGRLFQIAPNIRIGVALLAQYGARAKAHIRHALWRYSVGEYGYARRVLTLQAALVRNAERL